MAHAVCRNAIRDYLDASTPKTANAGLLLRRGMRDYSQEANDDGASRGGTEKSRLLGRIAALSSSPLYEAAFRRWQDATADGARFVRFEAGLIGRLYIGVTRESALETGLTVHHTWGTPLIPGSALKGLARHCARTQLKDHADAFTWLFGAETDSENELEAGGVVFHDAWWVPQGKPFVEEVVTPHHREYYNLGNAPATDFDSPVPAPQLAAQGSFLFVLEGEPAWCEIARALLQTGLANLGIGGKRSSGYGYFDIPSNG